MNLQWQPLKNVTRGQKNCTLLTADSVSEKPKNKTQMQDEESFSIMTWQGAKSLLFEETKELLESCWGLEKWTKSDIKCRVIYGKACDVTGLKEGFSCFW